MKNTAVFLGSPMIDVIAQVSPSFLEKYKLEPDTAYVGNEANRSVFVEVTTCHVHSRHVGGSVTNTVRVFHQISPESPLLYMGAIGSDSEGTFIKNKLSEESIPCSFAEIPRETTGKVAVLLTGGHRTLVTDLGASRKFSVANLEPTWGMLQDAEYFYFSAFFIPISMEVIRRIVDKFTPQGKTVAFNLAAPFLCEKYQIEMAYLYKSTTLVFGNEKEHRAFAKAAGVESAEDADLETVILEANKSLGEASRVVIATRGERPILALIHGRVEVFHVGLLDQDKVVDTNGAGDAFVGGFLARYVANKGRNIPECILEGISVARILVQRSSSDFLLRTKVDG